MGEGGTVSITTELLAGIEGNFDQLKPEVDTISEKNRKFRQAFGLVEVSRGIIPASSFEARWPGWEVSMLLSDPEVKARIEEIGGRPDLQVLAQQKLTAQTLDTALEVITARLKEADCGIHHARDVAELAIKLDNSRGSPKAQPAPRRRSFNLIARIATVVSPEYPDGLGVQVASIEGALALFRAMRCVEIDEFRAVWAQLQESLFVGALTLEGW
ncbi:hypothetical protein C6W92_17125 [Roseovarius sp. A46]|uniref:hypothetical protein n=1 Tax=Roseovarius sp. A46 TaxID=2109331 RepID=UPI0010104707|nr:hypothetical protein [Roseovarius sp. A46]RXV58077.1 hypothetical protein C6W92_17125 [Roseovarius sp. A46]